MFEIDARLIIDRYPEIIVLSTFRSSNVVLSMFQALSVSEGFQKWTPRWPGEWLNSVVCSQRGWQ